MTGFKDEKIHSHEHFTQTLKLIYKLLRGKQQVGWVPYSSRAMGLCPRGKRFLGPYV